MKVFVYGSLMGRLDEMGGTLIGKAIVKGFTLFSLGPFPAAKPREGHVVEGEVWEVSLPVMQHLDMIEGVPFLYDRRKTTATLHEGDPVAVVLYEYQGQVDRYPHVGARWEGRFRILGGDRAND